MSKITIHLTGYLAQLAGVKSYETHAQSVREALESLQQFEKLNPNLTSRRYVVKCSECDYVDQLDSQLTIKELHIKPQPYAANSLMGGGGDSGSLLRIVVGAVLVVVGVWLGDFSGTLAKIGSGLIAGGIGLMLGGVYSLLFPVEDPEASESDSLTQFSNMNTSESGTPIAIILGRHKFGGQLLSFNIDSVNRGASSTTPVTPKDWEKIL